MSDSRSDETIGNVSISYANMRRYFYKYKRTVAKLMCFADVHKSEASRRSVVSQGEEGLFSRVWARRDQHSNWMHCMSTLTTFAAEGRKSVIYQAIPSHTTIPVRFQLLGGWVRVTRRQSYRP